MNGTREASKQWSKKIAKTKKQCGFLEVASVPGLLYHPEHDLVVSCHGDDFLASGSKEALDFLDEIMVKEYETKILRGSAQRTWAASALKRSTCTEKSLGARRDSHGKLTASTGRS